MNKGKQKSLTTSNHRKYLGEESEVKKKPSLIVWSFCPSKRLVPQNLEFLSPSYHQDPLGTLDRSRASVVLSEFQVSTLLNFWQPMMQ